MASLKIVLERNKKQKAKMQLTDFEKFMQEQVLGERAGEALCLEWRVIRGACYWRSILNTRFF